VVVTNITMFFLSRLCVN